MKQRKRRKKWISLALVIILCLTGVYGAGVTDDIPVYASVSHARPNCQAAEEAGGEAGGRVSPAHGIGVPIQRFYQNASVRLPDGAQPRERIGQAHSELLQRARPGRRSHEPVEQTAAGSPGEYGQIALNCRSRENGQIALSSCRRRILSYIHDQDGQKDIIFSS